VEGIREVAPKKKKQKKEERKRKKTGISLLSPLLISWMKIVGEGLPYPEPEINNKEKPGHHLKNGGGIERGG